MIKTTSYSQIEIILNILKLHCPGGIEVDPTYSKGFFYENKEVQDPEYKFDLYPQTKETIKASAENLPFIDSQIKSIMFDPPFIAGNTTGRQGKIGERFGSFAKMDNLWNWYELCLKEFYRILAPAGVLIFKCQDNISGRKQYFSHVFIMNKAEQCGFYIKDLFVLNAKSRMIGHNHKNQDHARKFHSYFLVFEKRNINQSHK